MYPPPPKTHQPFQDMIWTQGPHLQGKVAWDSLEVLGEWLVLAALLLVALAVTTRLLARETSRPAPPAERRDPRLWTHLAFCLPLFAVAAWLRMNQILTEPLEMQEASEIYPIFQERWDLLRVVFLPNKMEPHQFLFPSALYPFGDLVADVRTLRYLPAAFGALVPVLTYLLAVSLRFPTAESVAAALVAAVAPFHVFFSRMMLPYTMANVFLLLMLVGAIGYARIGAPSWRRRALFVLAANLAMATHYATLPFGVLLVAGLLLTASSRVNRLLLLRDTSVAGLLFLPFAGRSLVYVLQPNSLAPHELLMNVEMFVDRPLLPEMLQYVRYATSSAFGLIAPDASGLARNIVASAFAATFGTGCITLFRRSRLQGAAVVVPAVFFLLFLTVVGPLGVYQKQQGIYFPPRRLVMLYPYVLIVAVAGLFALTSRLRGLRWPLRAAVLAPALVGWWIASSALHGEATLPAGGEAGRKLRQEVRDGDGILVGPSTWMRWIILTGLLERDDPRWISQMDTADFFELSLTRNPFPADAPAPGVMFNMPETFSFAETHLQRERLKRVWLVHIWQYTAGWPEIVPDHDHQETLRRLADRHFRKVETHSLRGVELTAYERVSRVPPPADGYDVMLGPLGHPFISLSWPPPAVPGFPEHERHFLAGGRLDLPLPAAGHWTVEIELRFEAEPELRAASFLWGDEESGYRVHQAMIGGDWSWLRYEATAPEAVELPSFIWEFRPPGAERPMGTDTWAHLLEVFEKYLRERPLQVRRIRVRPRATADSDAVRVGG